jgi:hypothetical protein
VHDQDGRERAQEERQAGGEVGTCGGYDEGADPFELTNVVDDPGNASLVSDLADRLRELRPGWPEASPSGAFVLP